MNRTAAKKDSGPAKPLRVLVVDDDPNDIDLCRRGLRRSGIAFQAVTVSTKKEFTQKLRAQPVDVVLSDYSMKGWNGMEALAILKEIRPEVPMILLTGTLGDEVAVECIKSGVSDYVLKNQLARLPVALRRAQEEKILREAEISAVKALRESEARYRGLVSNAAFGIFWVQEPQGELIDVNPALVKMLGYDSQEDFLRLRFTRLLYSNPEDQEKIVT